MKDKIPYKNFSKYILRTPLFSFSFYKNLTSAKKVSDIELKGICQNPVFSEALSLASPSLHTEMIKWISDEKESKNKEEKLKSALLKYISRMSSRCTPFGLFAGCSVGDFDVKTQIRLTKADKNRRHTRLDMNYLVSLSQDLVKNKKIRKQLLFFPNSSIYKSGNQIRYIEYKYVDGNRLHQVIEVENTEYLDRILRMSARGILLSELAKSLITDEINMEEALSFIEKLVDSQLIVSELEPSVSGPEFLEQICSVLNKLDSADEVLELLTEANHKINALDHLIGNDVQTYITLMDFLKRLKTDFEPKFMFQSDLVVTTNQNTLSHDIVNTIKKGLVILNKMTFPQKSNPLSQFKDAFYERFEEREVPLATALDVEIGLGYKQDVSQGDVSALVDDIELPERKNEQPGQHIQWNTIESRMHKLLIEALKNNSYTITLKDSDFMDFDASWNDLPDTISCMVEIVKIDGAEKIKFKGGGGSSAANLLGRFCHGDPQIGNFTKEIIAIETKINNDKILAEIVHLPESRVGNILMRPGFRTYEIPYLARSLKPEKHQIPLDDLFISVRNGNKIVLRSKRYNKEVIPHLTNAHNFSHNSLPIYNFLCDMQTQGIRNSVGFNFGPLSREYVFLPRVEYNNLIFHEASWNLKKDHIKPLLEKIDDDDEQLSKELNLFRKSLQIPQYVMLVDGDNVLLINFENLTSVRMLLDEVRKRSGFRLIEFLHTEEGIVKRDEDYYTNEVIISFYNDEKLNFDGTDAIQ